MLMWKVWCVVEGNEQGWLYAKVVVFMHSSILGIVSVSWKTISHSKESLIGIAGAQSACWPFKL